MAWIELIAVVWIGPKLIHPVPSPNWIELTFNDEIKAVVDTFAVRAVIEETLKEPELNVSALIFCGNVIPVPVRIPAVVETSWLVEI